MQQSNKTNLCTVENLNTLGNNSNAFNNQAVQPINLDDSILRLTLIPNNTQENFFVPSPDLEVAATLIRGNMVTPDLPPATVEVLNATLRGSYSTSGVDQGIHTFSANFNNLTLDEILRNEVRLVYQNHRTTSGINFETLMGSNLFNPQVQIRNPERIPVSIDTGLSGENLDQFFTEQNLIAFYEHFNVNILSSLANLFTGIIPLIPDPTLRVIMLIIVVKCMYPVLRFFTSTDFWSRSFGSIFISIRFSITVALANLRVFARNFINEAIRSDLVLIHDRLQQNITIRGHMVSEGFRSFPNSFLRFANGVWERFTNNGFRSLVITGAAGLAHLIFRYIANSQFLLDSTTGGEISSVVLEQVRRFFAEANNLNEILASFLRGQSTPDYDGVRILLEQLREFFF